MSKDIKGGLVDAVTECYDCDFEGDAKNSFGLGVQHSRKYSHNVLVSVSYGYRIGPEVLEEKATS